MFIYCALLLWLVVAPGRGYMPMFGASKNSTSKSLVWHGLYRSTVTVLSRQFCLSVSDLSSVVSWHSFKLSECFQVTV